MTDKIKQLDVVIMKNGKPFETFIITNYEDGDYLVEHRNGSFCINNLEGEYGIIIESLEQYIVKSMVDNALNTVPETWKKEI